MDTPARRQDWIFDPVYRVEPTLKLVLPAEGIKPPTMTMSEDLGWDNRSVNTRQIPLIRMFADVIMSI